MIETGSDRPREVEAPPFRRRHHVRGVGFEKKAITRHLVENRQFPGLAGLKEVTREGEKSAELDESFHHFRRPAVRVEQQPDSR